MATDRYPAARDWFVLVAGWPGSGKSTPVITVDTSAPVGIPPLAATLAGILPDTFA